MNNPAIVIPTYNARKSIIKLVEEIFAVVPHASVWIVDDSSPDKTAAVVKQKFGLNSQVRVLIRPAKSGRGSAVLEGFKKALTDNTSDIFIEMDADGSHDPTDLPKFLQAIKRFDVVIGSRYMEMSQIIDWTKSRRIFSRLANTWARLILGVPISDYTNGYRCYRREVLEALDFNNIRANGFAALSEMIYAIYLRKFTIGEVPAIFKYRQEYGSNFNPREIIETFFTLIRIRMS